ncbi:MAG: hypothetical protein EBT26_05275 [Microbacteriaceae bacterium]|nr:hypothetical protein [Microbacteriaceae bacterium]NBS61437.1 hypothetical protein [Microbacteriaceae bacterium]
MIDRALKKLRPGAEWSLTGDTYSGITWHDQTQTQPTQEEVVAAIETIKAEIAATEYQRLRAREYPPVTDYLDAVVKGDQAQIDKYIQDCLAVKAKYPKPE